MEVILLCKLIVQIIMGPEKALAAVLATIDHYKGSEKEPFFLHGVLVTHHPLQNWILFG